MSENTKKFIDLNKSFVLRNEDRAPKWRLIDATGKIVGRLATEVADVLRGKDKPSYTPHTDGGDYVVVINCDKIEFSGNKWEDKTYWSYSGYRGGKKIISAKDLHTKDSAQIIEKAVKGMMPKTKIARAQSLRLKAYSGNEHPHKAQIG